MEPFTLQRLPRSASRVFRLTPWRRASRVAGGEPQRHHRAPIRHRLVGRDIWYNPDYSTGSYSPSYSTGGYYNPGYSIKYHYP